MEKEIRKEWVSGNLFLDEFLVTKRKAIKFVKEIFSKKDNDEKKI
ncbi:MAG: hypothetical protein RR254_04420 [Muribaculaceae bacterium]